MFTYSDNLFSDLHKDVYGFRPRDARMDEWTERTPRQKQELWDALCDELEENEKNNRRAEAEALTEFREQIRMVIKTCHVNWKKALEYLANAENEDISCSQSFDYFLWKQGIGFTDRLNVYKLYKEVS